MVRATDQKSPREAVEFVLQLLKVVFFLLVFMSGTPKKILIFTLLVCLMLFKAPCLFTRGCMAVFRFERTCIFVYMVMLFFELDSWPIVHMRTINRLSFSNYPVFAKLSRFEVQLLSMCNVNRRQQLLWQLKNYYI